MTNRRHFAHAAFFPAAALYSAVVLPWSVLTLSHEIPAPPGLLAVGGHAHEMLFGYAMAVVAGYLLGPQPLAWLRGLLICWIGARISFLIAPGALVTLLINGFFAGLVAYRVMPRFMKSARKWRNKVVAPVVGGLALSATAGAGLVGSMPASAGRALHAAVMLLAVLLFFMGGRIIAPAVAGYRIRRGEKMHARVQPAVEGAVLMLLCAVVLITPWRNAVPAALHGGPLIIAAILVLVRWLRWQPWRCLPRPDLLFLLSGYLWLAVGLLLTGLSSIIDQIPPVAATHAITAGALGTLSLVVMMRTRLLYRFRDANRLPLAHLAAVLVQAAALARVVPPMLNASAGWLLVSACLWSLAYLLCLAVLMQTRDQTGSV